jgi:hypothetical protein
MAGPIQYAPVAAPERPEKRSAFHKIDRIAPLLGTTPLTLAARLWMWHAGHALGYIPLFGGLSAGAVLGAVISAAAKARGAVGICLALAGGFAGAAVAGNAVSAWPAFASWAVGTTIGYGVNLPIWRAEEHHAEDRQERMNLATMQANTTIQTELIRGQVALGVAATHAHAYVTGETIKAEALRDTVSRFPTPHVPDADPSIFEVSRSGRQALDEPVTIPAASEFGFARADERLAA